MSNGARLVSAIAAVKNRTNASSIVITPNSATRTPAPSPEDAPQPSTPQFHGKGPWALTSAPGSSVPNARNTGISDSPIATSYDIICDELRRPPSSAHLL